MFQHTAARRRLAAIPSPGCIAHSFNTQPPEGGWQLEALKAELAEMFQHTAARRRLVGIALHDISFHTVSTHSRPKAAGYAALFVGIRCPGFNTQPPEGGWFRVTGTVHLPKAFQHTAARRRLGATASAKRF